MIIQAKKNLIFQTVFYTVTKAKKYFTEAAVKPLSGKWIFDKGTYSHFLKKESVPALKPAKKINRLVTLSFLCSKKIILFSTITPVLKAGVTVCLRS